MSFRTHELIDERSTRRRLTSLLLVCALAVLVSLAGCSATRLPSEDLLSEVRAGNKTIVLIRFTGEKVDGTPLKAFEGWGRSPKFATAFLTSDSLFGFTNELEWFLSEETRQDGWTYYILEPGIHYMAVQPPMNTDAFTYMSRWKSAPRWRIDLPEGKPIVYVGTLDLRGIPTETLFGQPYWLAIDGRRSQVLNEEGEARKIASEHLANAGEIYTALMKPVSQ